MSQAIERTAECIREWLAITGHGPSPKPMAHTHISAGDPLVLARIALSTIRHGLGERPMEVARLALIMGTAVEREAGAASGEGWTTEAQVRVGLVLIDCAMRATGWLSLAVAPDDGSQADRGLGPRLTLVVLPGAIDVVGRDLDREVPRGEGYSPTFGDFAPPFGTIRTLVGGRSVQVAMTEAAG